MKDVLTDEMLRQIMPNAPRARRAESLPILNDVMRAYEINNEQRAAAWLATLAVESGELKYQQELASGAAYEGREDLGNTEAGDGKRFKGHGRIQITGRFNHKAYTDYLRKKNHLPFVDFVQNPARLAEEPYATDSAGWFWAVLKRLNPVADRGEFLKTQIAVNGRNKKTGLPNHWDERKDYYERARAVLSDGFVLDAPEVVEAPNAPDAADDSAPSVDVHPPAAPQGDKPIVTPVEAPKTSIVTKIGAAASAAGPIVAATGLKIGGVEFKTGGLIAFAAVVIVGMIIAAWLWNQSQERAFERQKMSINNLADPERKNIVAAGSKV